MSRQVDNLLLQFPSLFVLMAMAYLIRDFARNPHPRFWARLIFANRPASTTGR